MLKPELNQVLLAASAKTFETSQRHPDHLESFTNLHKSCKRALQLQLIEYKHAILIHKFYIEQLPETDWIELNKNTF